MGWVRHGPGDALAAAGRITRDVLAGLANRESARRLHLVLVLSAGLGVATGVAVAGFEWLVRDHVFDSVGRQSLWIASLAPALGLVLAVICVQRFGDGDSATADGYIRAYHQRSGELSIRGLPAKIAACAATLGGGGALGYEGPAILIGATFGSFAERRFTSRFTSDDAKVLMVAGAAAGVAAVFKAPLTGLVFALEVPYTQDLARRALLPALVAAGSSYLSFVSLLGTKPLLAFGGPALFDVRDLLGGLAVGLLCGVLARAGAWAIGHAKHFGLRQRYRLPLAGSALCALAIASKQLFDAPLTIGSGYGAIAWARSHQEALALLVALFVVRCTATWVTLAGGGVGGLFIPLVTQGAILGQIVQAVVHANNPGLFPTVGIAAFLGAGYRTPLAGVAFVAEATGQPGFVVPALLAAAAAQLAMGRWSFSKYQHEQRHVTLLPTTGLQVGEIMSPNPDTVDAGLPLDEAVQLMMRANRRWVPVVDDHVYVGLLSIVDAAAIASADWPAKRCIDVARQNLDAASVFDSVAAVAHSIRSTGGGAVAVTDSGQVVGVVTLRDIENVERLLDRLAPDNPAH